VIPLTQSEIIYYKITAVLTELTNAYGDQIPATIVNKSTNKALVNPTIDDIESLAFNNSREYRESFDSRNLSVMAESPRVRSNLLKALRMYHLLIHGRQIECSHEGCKNAIITDNENVTDYICPYHKHRE